MAGRLQMQQLRRAEPQQRQHRLRRRLGQALLQDAIQAPLTSEHGHGQDPGEAAVAAFQRPHRRSGQGLFQPAAMVQRPLDDREGGPAGGEAAVQGDVRLGGGGPRHGASWVRTCARATPGGLVLTARRIRSPA